MIASKQKVCAKTAYFVYELFNPIILQTRKANTFQQPFKIQSEDKHCNFFYKRELKCINFIVNLEKPGIKHVKVALKGRLANLKAID